MLLTTAIRRSLNVSLKSIYSGGSSRSLAILAPATDSQQSPLADPKKVEKANSTKHEISFEFHEHCKSGSDSEAAELTNTAYGKNTPKPHEQMVAAAEESKKVSPSMCIEESRSIPINCTCGCWEKNERLTVPSTAWACIEPLGRIVCQSSRERSPRLELRRKLA